MTKLIACFILLLSFSVFTEMAEASEKKCDKHEGIKFCYYPGDVGTPKLVYFFHGYGDDENTWDYHGPTKGIQAAWKKSGVLRPNVVTVSRGKWWYTEKAQGQKLDSFVSWFESKYISFLPMRMLYGESMGGHNAYRWILDSPHLFSRLALTCPAFPKSFVTDAPVGSSVGPFELFANVLLYNRYRHSSQKGYNPLLHSVNENTKSALVAAHIVVSDIDGYGFYDGGLAVHRALSKEVDIKATLEVQNIWHCEHDSDGLARFLAE